MCPFYQLRRTKAPSCRKGEGAVRKRETAPGGEITRETITWVILDHQPQLSIAFDKGPNVSSDPNGKEREWICTKGRRNML